jgi:hypothetical protein
MICLYIIKSVITFTPHTGEIGAYLTMVVMVTTM